MKKKSVLHTLLAAGVVLCGSAANANHDSSLAARHVATLESLSSGMVQEYRENLSQMHRHCDPSRVERRFLGSLSNLAAATCSLRRTLDACSPCCELERAFNSVKESFDCVENSADDVEVCSCLRGMMRRFEDTMDSLEDVGFEAVARPAPTFEHHRHHHDDDDADRSGTRFGIRIPLPPGLPFEFRRPF